MDGELALAGDTTRLDFAAPCAGGNMIMSLASSFSFNSGKDPTGQVTNVDVITSSTSARRLTSCAGGNDDGAFLQIDGALITVGGIGDNPANPAPNCTRGADDDELYNLALGNSADANPFLKNGDTFVQFETNNPSFNDNVYLLAFTTGFQVSRVDGSPTLPGLTVPEPESLGLVSLGLLGVAWVRRRAWSIRRTRWTA